MMPSFEVLLANRDGKMVFRLADVTRERRTGNSRSPAYASALLAVDYPAWQKKWQAK
jgi:hypothetical protein